MLRIVPIEWKTKFTGKSFFVGHPRKNVRLKKFRFFAFAVLQFELRSSLVFKPSKFFAFAVFRENQFVCVILEMLE